MKHLLGLGLGFLLLAGCAGLPDMAALKQGVGLTPPPAAPAPPPDPQTQMTALEDRIRALIAQERQTLDPKARLLAPDPELARIARQRASDMAAQNYLAHAAPNGDTSATLLMAQDEKFQGLLGENLAAQHYTKQSGVDVDGFARRFVEQWMKSTPHRENLAFADYDHTGVGAAVNGDTVYVAQLFSTDLGLAAARDPDSKATAFASPADARSAARATGTTGETGPPPLRLRGATGGLPAGRAPAR